ncbi:hypothetical protein DUNSADRAFT_482 [Dunaliella salina]|uniref:Uncharacterized protein n=1 Tax=Dunaliella salina TaxID=3046 RepID=A0ABQ7FYU5_DUNSA|nr:hypothetical protein DUNSADRAFT_482 [Dunaliella salina]|eukprot:KAF5827535.1 hypothetical protein DUNSADRAFT_482 [Dunaliella salina]
MMLQRPAPLRATSPAHATFAPVGLPSLRTRALRVVAAANAPPPFTIGHHFKTASSTNGVICRSAGGRSDDAGQGAGKMFDGEGGESGAGMPPLPPVRQGGEGGAGGAGVGRRPGGPSGPSGPSGGPSGPPSGGPGPKLPGGWTWRQVLFVALGVAMTLPLFNYVKERLVSKPQELPVSPEDVTPEAPKSKSRLGRAASNVKHATLDPVKNVVNRFAPHDDVTEEAKRSEAARGVQHKVEDVKDKADTKFYDTTSKAERGYSHLQKDVKQGAEDVREKGADVAAGADRTVHKTSVKGGRVLGERVPEKASDMAYETKKTTKSAGKSMLDSIKNAPRRVGRALHLVADSTEKGTAKAERAVKQKTSAVKEKTTEEQRKNAYYVAGGVALGLAALGGLYYYDRQGGDLGGKVKKMQGKTREFTHKSASAAEKAANKASSAAEKGASTATEKGKESIEKAKEFAAERRAVEPAGIFKSS